MALKNIMMLRDFGTRNYLDVFPQEVFATIADDHALLLKTVPTRVLASAEKKSASAKRKRGGEDNEDDHEDKKRMP